MTMNRPEITFHPRIDEIGIGDWNALAVGAGPFLQYEFLHALEESGSVGRGTGWIPCHLAVRHPGESSPVLLAPLYRKMHSWGEYVFDWAWADAWHRHGREYYPKLVSAVPFTPSAGPRLLGHPGTLREAGSDLLQGVRDRMSDRGESSWHVLFPEEEQALLLEREGLIRRRGSQFRWYNRGYRDFDDFLTHFNSRRRKNVRKERRNVEQAGVECHRFTGREIDESLWDRFYTFYQNTYAQRGMQGYLTRRFFSLIGEQMPDKILLVLARQDGDWVAGALYLHDDRRLYGRYWGSVVDVPGLHFEACYYQGIEYCIRNGLEYFDAGAQGEHKLARGFEPVETCSLHWIEDEAFRDAVARFCDEEAAWVDGYREAASGILPYRRDGQSGDL